MHLRATHLATLVASCWLQVSCASPLAPAVQGRRNPASLTGFPRIAHYAIGGQTPFDNLASHGRYDLEILGTWPGFSFRGQSLRQIVQGIKDLHPAQKIAKYTILMEASGDPGSANRDLYQKYQAEKGPGGRRDWWAYDKDGGHLSSYPGTWTVNICPDVLPDSSGYRVPEFLAHRDHGMFFAPIPELDLWFCDNVFYKPRVDADWSGNGVNESQQDGGVRAKYRRAIAGYAETARTLAPGIGLIANSDGKPGHIGYLNESEYRGLFAGALYEAAIGATWSTETSDGWEKTMANYRDLIANTVAPHWVIFQAWVGALDLIAARYAIASALMDDGFIAIAADGNYSLLTWYDEYDQGGKTDSKWLGLAVDPPPTGPWRNGVYLRRFEHGLALVNPKGNGTRKVDLPAGYRHFYGPQDPFVNDGKSVSSVTLPERWGMVLVKE